MYHFVPGLFDEPKFDSCASNCPYPILIAQGDRTGYVVTGRHLLAEKAREARKIWQKYSPNHLPYWQVILAWLKKIFIRKDIF